MLILPVDPGEIHAALNRPPHLQTPIPKVGDTVGYRHHEWGDVTVAEVLAVQDMDDSTDPYLWHVVTTGAGTPLVDGAGRRVLHRAPDPWPTLTLATDWGRRATREARVRGSAGWLPLGANP